MLLLNASLYGHPLRTGYTVASDPIPVETSLCPEVFSADGCPAPTGFENKFLAALFPFGLHEMNIFRNVLDFHVAFFVLWSAFAVWIVAFRTMVVASDGHAATPSGIVAAASFRLFFRSMARGTFTTIPLTRRPSAPTFATGCPSVLPPRRWLVHCSCGARERRNPAVAPSSWACGWRHCSGRHDGVFGEDEGLRTRGTESAHSAMGAGANAG